MFVSVMISKFVVGYMMRMPSALPWTTMLAVLATLDDARMA